MEENMSHPDEINSSVYFNKKRKFQLELLGMPSTKHLRGNRLYSDDSIIYGRILGIQGNTDDQSSNDSNNFHGDVDSIKFIHSEDEMKTLSCNEPSSSSVSWHGLNTEIELDSPESRLLMNSCSKNTESISFSESSYEDDLLEFTSHNEDSCFHNTSDDNPDKELYDLLCLSGISPGDYILSSGRQPADQGADIEESEPEKLTIDKEFEQYFSMLML